MRGKRVVRPARYVDDCVAVSETDDKGAESFLVRFPEGATGIQRFRHLLEGIGPAFRYIPAFSLEGHQAR